MIRSIFISVFFLFLSTQCVRSQLKWTPIPFGKPIQCFALGTDGNIYVAWPFKHDSSAVFRSTDSGTSWSKILDAGWLYSIVCDSSGNVVVVAGLNSSFTPDSGRTWQPFNVFGSSMTGIEAANDGFYETDYYNNLYFTRDDGRGWETKITSTDTHVDDWDALYCGSEDREVLSRNSDGGLLRLNSGVATSDTSANPNGAQIDPGAPKNLVFGYDGYIYAATYYGLVRLPPGRGKWELYDSDYSFHQDNGIFIPLASDNKIQSLIFVDSGATFASTDNCETWHIIGGGIPTNYPLSLAFDHRGIGYALAGASGILYTTANLTLSVLTPQQSPQISLFPSPCSASLNFYANNVKRICIFDLLGVARLEHEYNDVQNPTLDVSALHPGIYAVDVTSASGTNVVRMVKE